MFCIGWFITPLLMCTDSWKQVKFLSYNISRDSVLEKHA